MLTFTSILMASTESRFAALRVMLEHKTVKQTKIKRRMSQTRIERQTEESQVNGLESDE